MPCKWFDRVKLQVKHRSLQDTEELPLDQYAIQFLSPELCFGRFSPKGEAGLGLSFRDLHGMDAKRNGNLSGSQGCSMRLVSTFVITQQ